MTDLPDDVIGDAYTNAFAWEFLESLTDIGNRMAGQPGEKQAASLLMDTLERAGGKNIREATFQTAGWWRDSAHVEIISGPSKRFDESRHVIALPNAPSTTLQAPVIDLGAGTPATFDDADVENKIVLVSSESPDDHRWIHRNEKFALAVNGNAAGFLFYNASPGCLPPTGSIGIGDNIPASIPGLGLSKETGNKLVRYCDDHEELIVELETRCSHEQTVSRNVEAELNPGCDSELLVTGHFDAHDISDGAADNGIGVAVIVEICRLLSSVESELDQTVRFVAFGGEEVGFRGSQQWVAANDTRSITAVMNVDTAGTSRTLKLKTNGFETFETVFDTVCDDLQVPYITVTEVKADTDHWPFITEGIPGATANSTSDESGRGWAHTHADTLDKLDIRDLRSIAVILSAGVCKMTREEFDFGRITQDELRSRIDDDKLEVLKLTGKWPSSESDEQ